MISERKRKRIEKVIQRSEATAEAADEVLQRMEEYDRWKMKKSGLIMKVLSMKLLWCLSTWENFLLPRRSGIC